MRSLFLTTCAIFILCNMTALSADEYVVVPKSVDEVEDSELKQALAVYSANYQWLVRDNQVRDFVHVYKTLNNDKEPNISPEDKELLAQAARPVQVSGSQVTQYAPVQTNSRNSRPAGKRYNYHGYSLTEEEYRQASKSDGQLLREDLRAGIREYWLGF